MDIVFVPLNTCRGAQEAMGAFTKGTRNPGLQSHSTF